MLQGETNCVCALVIYRMREESKEEKKRFAKRKHEVVRTGVQTADFQTPKAPL